MLGLEPHPPETLEKVREVADATYRALETEVLLNIPNMRDKQELEDLMLAKVKPGKGQDNFAAVLSALAHEIVSDFVLERHLEDDEEAAIEGVKDNIDLLTERMLQFVTYYPSELPGEEAKIKIKEHIF